MNLVKSQNVCPLNREMCESIILIQLHWPIHLPKVRIMNDPLYEEFQWYIQSQDEFVRQYDGQYIVLKNGKVIGAYDTDLAAVLESQKNHCLGTFLVQKVTAGDSAYSQKFQSRVAFS